MQTIYARIWEWVDDEKLCFNLDSFQSRRITSFQTDERMYPGMAAIGQQQQKTPNFIITTFKPKSTFEFRKWIDMIVKCDEMGDLVFFVSPFFAEWEIINFKYITSVGT